MSTRVVEIAIMTIPRAESLPRVRPRRIGGFGRPGPPSPVGEDDRECEFADEHGGHQIHPDTMPESERNDDPAQRVEDPRRRPWRIPPVVVDLYKGAGQRPQPVGEVGGDVSDEQDQIVAYRGVRTKTHEADADHDAGKREGQETQKLQEAGSEGAHLDDRVTDEDGKHGAQRAPTIPRKTLFFKESRRSGRAGWPSSASSHHGKSPALGTMEYGTSEI